MYPDKYTKQFWLEHIEENLKAHRTEFLDRDELGILKKLAEQVLAKSLHKNLGVECDTAFSVLEYVDRYEGKELLSINNIMYLVFLLLRFELEETLDDTDKQIIWKIMERCGFIVHHANEICPLEQQRPGLFDFDDEIEKLQNRSALTGKKQRRTRMGFAESGENYVRLFDAQTEALQLGKKMLQVPDNIRALKDLMTATKVDEDHNEHWIAGEHASGVHKNSGMYKGFKNFVNPVYHGKENTLFHSHVSKSPLSYAVSKDTYNPKKIRREGDLAHSVVLNKNVFAINSEGDIFFTTPKLSGICLDDVPGCDLSSGQVYLGNIKDYRK